MHRIVGITIVLSSLAAGCGDDGEMFANVHWRVRCPQSGNGVCSSSGPPRDVMASESEVGIDCEIVDLSNDNRVLNMEVRLGATDAGEPASFELDSLVFTPSFAVISGTVAVEESGPFEGRADEQCEVSQLGRVDTENGEAIVGEVLCRELSNPFSPDQLRDLTSPDGADEPATFSLARCEGL